MSSLTFCAYSPCCSSLIKGLLSDIADVEVVAEFGIVQFGLASLRRIISALGKLNILVNSPDVTSDEDTDVDEMGDALEMTKRLI